jgi:hypothetical protein
MNKRSATTTMKLNVEEAELLLDALSLMESTKDVNRLLNRLDRTLDRIYNQ